MLFFLICADEAAGRAECAARGWTQAGVARFFTPDRDDVRVVRRFTDVALLPGGTWLIAGADYMRNPERAEFDGLVSKGAARWAVGGEPKEIPVDSEDRAVIEAMEAFGPEMAPPTTRDAWPPRTAPPLLTGGHRGPRPSRR
jgi:hypothetical protein